MKKSRYAETCAAWQRDPLNFWAEAAKEIDWIQAPRNIFDALCGAESGHRARTC
jgi:propionyl-CoA synthetase